MKRASFIKLFFISLLDGKVPMFDLIRSSKFGREATVGRGLCSDLSHPGAPQRLLKCVETVSGNWWKICFSAVFAVLCSTKQKFIWRMKIINITSPFFFSLLLLFALPQKKEPEKPVEFSGFWGSSLGSGRPLGSQPKGGGFGAISGVFLSAISGVQNLGDFFFASKIPKKR